MTPSEEDAAGGPLPRAVSDGSSVVDDGHQWEDFTCSTRWEDFVRALEDVLRDWKSSDRGARSNLDEHVCHTARMGSEQAVPCVWR